MNTFIDIGINLTNKQFNNEHNEIINLALATGVHFMILTGTSIRGSKESAEIARNYQDVLFSTAGIHPHDAKSFNSESINELRKLLKLNHVISVGECGLDFDRDFSPRPIQEKCYRAQLELSIEINKPLFLHERAAFKRFNEITDEYLLKLPKAVVHCFTGTYEQALQAISYNLKLGIGGVVTFKNGKIDQFFFSGRPRCVFEIGGKFQCPVHVSLF